MQDNLIFIDTNILVYAYDEADHAKNNICFRIIEDCFMGKRKLAISNQVLAEFASVTNTKISNPFPLEKTQKIISWVNEYDGYLKLNYSTRTVEHALTIAKIHQTSLWDALIAATMIENAIFTIYTENVKDFSRIPGIKVVNPLH